MLKFPSIPEPQADVNALYQSVSALKQIAEELIGQRGTDGTTIASQTDLADVSDLLSVVKKAADAASPVGHTHPESDVTSLVADIASKEPAITGSGNSADYYGGDKTFHALTIPPQKLAASYATRLTTSSTITTAFSTGSSPPSNTQGVQILSLTVVTTSSTQVVDLFFSTYASCTTNSFCAMAAAIYVNGTAVAASGATANGFQTGPMAFGQRYAPGAAGTYTVTVRIGVSSSGLGILVNGLFGTAGNTALLANVIEP